MRDELDSSFYIWNSGNIMVWHKEKKVVGSALAKEDPPDLLGGERWLLERWRETDVLLKEIGLRSKILLDAERGQGFDYGFLYASFGFYRKRIERRWGEGYTQPELQAAVEHLSKTLEKAQPQAGLSFEYDARKRRYIFDMEIADRDEAEKFFAILLDHIAQYPALGLTMGPA